MEEQQKAIDRTHLLISVNGNLSLLDVTEITFPFDIIQTEDNPGYLIANTLIEFFNKKSLEERFKQKVDCVLARVEELDDVLLMASYSSYYEDDWYIFVEKTLGKTCGAPG